MSRLRILEDTLSELLLAGRTIVFEPAERPSFAYVRVCGENWREPTYAVKHPDDASFIATTGGMLQKFYVNNFKEE